MSNKTALVGMHNEAISELTSIVLGDKGYVAESDSKLEGVLKLIREKHYDAVITDINLGKAGSDNIGPGIEIYKGLERALNEGSTKLVFISGHPDNQVNFSNQFGSQKNVAYLEKPYTNDQLLALLD